MACYLEDEVGFIRKFKN